MKNKIISALCVSVLLISSVYFVLMADSFYQEYVADNFVYWGYPQWGWMYANQDVYFTFNVIYLTLMLVCLVLGIWSFAKKHIKAAFVLGFFPLLSAAVFAYMPTYNWNQQFALFNAEKGESKSRIPEGKWWVSLEQMQKYDDASAWEKLKGVFGRGEWPGGYDIWGDYRAWLLPDFATDTLGRRGMVVHGGVKKASPWGIDMGDNIIDFAIRLRESKEPLALTIDYGEAAGERQEDKSEVIDHEKAE